jgi:hypothetical protein
MISDNFKVFVMMMIVLGIINIILAIGLGNGGYCYPLEFTCQGPADSIYSCTWHCG